MLNLNQAIQHGRAVGVRFYVKTTGGAIFGGTKTTIPCTTDIGVFATDQDGRGISLHDFQEPLQIVRFQNHDALVVEHIFRPDG